MRGGQAGIFQPQHFLPVVFSLGHAGQDHVDFGSTEPHTVLFHEPGSSSVWVGGRNRVYVFDFSKGRNASVRTVSLDPLLPPSLFFLPHLLLID